MVQIPQMVDLPTGQTMDSRLRALSSSRLCIFCQSGQKTVSALRYNTRTQPQRKQQPITSWIRLCIYIYLSIPPSRFPNINPSKKESFASRFTFEFLVSVIAFWANHITFQYFLPLSLVGGPTTVVFMKKHFQADGIIILDTDVRLSKLLVHEKDISIIWKGPIANHSFVAILPSLRSIDLQGVSLRLNTAEVDIKLYL